MLVSKIYLKIPSGLKTLHVIQEQEQIKKKAEKGKNKQKPWKWVGNKRFIGKQRNNDMNSSIIIMLVQDLIMVNKLNSFQRA